MHPRKTSHVWVYLYGCRWQHNAYQNIVNHAWWVYIYCYISPQYKIHRRINETFHEWTAIDFWKNATAIVPVCISKKILTGWLKTVSRIWKMYLSLKIVQRKRICVYKIKLQKSLKLPGDPKVLWNSLTSSWMQRWRESTARWCYDRKQSSPVTFFLNHEVHPVPLPQSLSLTQPTSQDKMGMGGGREELCTLSWATRLKIKIIYYFNNISFIRGVWCNMS